MRKSVMAILFVAGLFSEAVQAIPITYTESDVISGTLAGVAFTDVLMTLNGSGATEDVTSGGLGLFANALATTTITLGSLGTGSFTAPVTWQVSQSFGIAGLGIPGSTILGVVGGALSSYELKTAIGPISGLTFAGSIPYGTSLGELVITEAAQGTFTAVTEAVPEPGSLALLGLGLAGLFGARRRY